nr:FAD-dependent oxidoreductase [Mycobacterium riyadhense]
MQVALSREHPPSRVLERNRGASRPFRPFHQHLLDRQASTNHTELKFSESYFSMGGWMDTQVLIVGGGPTGLTLAIELARRGVHVRILDKAERFAIGSRGHGLQPRTLEVFEDLGVLDEVCADGMGAPQVRIYDGLAVVGERRIGAKELPSAETPFPNPWFLPQWRTEEILRSRLSRCGVQVELGAEVVAVKQADRPDGHAVTVRLGNGELVRAGYVVGADGVRSTVRRALAIPFVGITDDKLRVLQADLRLEGLDHDYGHVWMLDGSGSFALMPLPGATDAFVLSTTVLSTMGDAAEPTVSGLQATLNAVSERADIQLREITWATTWRLNVRMAQSFRAGRVLLAGDAAHVDPPNGGQGLNTGVQDAYNLGWKLAAVLAGAPDELLDSYEAERMPAAERALAISAEMLAKTMRGSADALERSAKTRQLELSYRDGPLTLDDCSSAALAAGDRAPDAPMLANGRRARLFTLFAGAHWTLLRFGRGAPYLDHSCVHSYEIGNDILDTDRHIRRVYDIDDDAAVLVRPDGYIGAITSDLASLTAYRNWLLPRG